MMKVRKATITEFDRIMEIYRYAQDYMIRSGNPGQWGHFYPAPELIKSLMKERYDQMARDDCMSTRIL